METTADLLDILKYNVSKAQTAGELYEKTEKKIALGTFRRNLRHLSAEARKLGHRVIGDDNGYYMAMNDYEWNVYKTRRYAAIKDELVSLAAPDGMSVPDIIKLVYKVKVDDPNLTLNL